MLAKQFLAAYAAALPTETGLLLMEYILERTTSFLGFDEDEVVYPDEAFFDLGFDSLRAVDFKLLLEDELGFPLSSTVLLDCATPRILAEYLGTVMAPATSDAAASEGKLHTPGEAPLTPLAPLAIVAMAGRFPGGSNDLRSFWDLIESGRDGIEEIPGSRWDADDFYDPDPEVAGRMYTKWGGFLEGIGDFDAGYFGISPREARAMDPAQRILLEVTAEALQSGNLLADDLRGTSTGVFIGTRGADYFQGQTNWRPEDAGRYYATGNSASTLAGRISYQFDLRGPCFSLDTACSSSLVALHQAAQALAVGECDAAIVGGVNVVLDPFGTMAICKAQMLSADGRCKAFDASADGYVRSEGCGVIVVKTLESAQRDGNRILALVRGSAVNQDGASAGLTVPSTEAQEGVIRKALGQAGLAPDQVDYIEAHGTGTSLGDPIEIAALDAVFGTSTRADKLQVGTIKTQIGHLEPAAGIAGLIRVALSLGREKLRPNLHFHEPNPFIPWDKTIVSIVAAERPWPRNLARARIAGINSFGFSGTNAHVILEEAPAPVQSEPAQEQPELLLLSAKTPAALAKVRDSYVALLESPQSCLADLARTAALGRDHHGFRLAVMAQDKPHGIQVLTASHGGDFENRTPPTAPRIAFLYTGQGSQFCGMGAELYASFSPFREAFDAAAEAVARHSDLDLRELLFGPGSASAELDSTDVTQPVLFGIEYALTALWSSVGVKATWVLGHSIGEFAAACASGVLDLDDAAKMVVARGKLMMELTSAGAMLAVFAEPGVVQPLCELASPDLAIAARNCDARVSVSGSESSIDKLAGLLDSAGLKYERLRVSRAFHSPLMDPMLKAFGLVAGTVAYSQPTCQFISTLTASVQSGPDCELLAPDYWTRHVREPVRFLDAMRLLESESPDVLLEVGPAPHLLGLAKRFLERDGLHFLPSMRPQSGARLRFLESLGALHSAGIDVDWSPVFPARSGPMLEIPTYPFERSHFWLAPRGQSRNQAESLEGRPLLGVPVDSSRLDSAESLFLATHPYNEQDPLRDHAVMEQAIFPVAGYLSVAVEAARATSQLPNGPVCVESLEIYAALVLGPDGMRMETLVEEGAGTKSIRIFGAKGTGGSDGHGASKWEPYARAEVRESEPSSEPLAFDVGAWDRCTREVDATEHYSRTRRVGLTYGSAYQTCRGVRVGDGECVVSVRSSDGGTYPNQLVDPSVLDGCLQGAVFVVPKELEGTPFLPLGFEQLHVLGPIVGEVTCHLRRLSVVGRMLKVAFSIVDLDGELLASCAELRLLETDRSTLLALDNPLAGLAFHREWVAKKLTHKAPSAGDARRVLIASDCSAGVRATELVQQLQASFGSSGAHVSSITIDLSQPDSWADQLDACLSDGSPTDVLDLTWCFAQTSLGEPGSLKGHLDWLLGCLSRTRDLRPRFWAVTNGAGLDGEDLGGSALWGAARSITLEEPALRFTCVDLDPLFVDATALLHEVLADGPEREIALRDGRRFVARIKTGASSGQADSAQLSALDSGPWRLAIQRYGSLENLVVQATNVPEPKADEVRIEVHCAALNFKDVLFTLGVLKDYTGITRSTEQKLGHECAGRVIAVGEGIAKLGSHKVGDDVFAAALGSLQSEMVLPGAEVMPKPQGLTMAEAAGLPTVFLTALYGLERVAKIGPGDKVLIHAAAGGVGQAAIQIARRAGAMIFATASRGKWPFLREQGIEHIFDSRSLDYRAAILAATEDQGVDIVLDSMAGEHVEASLGSLAKGGCFIELGKIGTWTKDEVSSARPDVSYSIFDMGDLLAGDPDLYASLRSDLCRAFESREFEAPRLRVFDLGQTRAAFRHLAAARNVGKVAISFPTRHDAGHVVREGAAYLITGGLGSLGLHVAAWLGREGAGEVHLVGRSGLSPSSAEKLDELRGKAPATQFIVSSGDAADGSRIQELVSACELPLRGVFHAAGVLEDGMLADMDSESFERVLTPKWKGAWSLHRACLEEDLEHFVLFSSMTAMVGAAGQANYAAANNGLDAFARWRRSKGLPATSIAWGPWSGGGMATRAASAESLDAAGIAPISPAVGVDVLGRLLRTPQYDHSVGILAVDWERYLGRREALPLFGELLGGVLKSEQHQAELFDATGLTTEQLPAAILGCLAIELAGVLGYASADEVNTSMTFNDLGVDSLLAVDMRNRLERVFGCELPVTVLFDYADPVSLSAALKELLLNAAAQTAPNDEAAAKAAAEADLRTEIDALSDAQVSDLLAEGEASEDDYFG